MYVEELVIDGFKSYAVRTVISGWDRQFNAITGLNGSGKSNVLDAICFVLGISNTSNLRAQSLQDLIYKRGQAGITKASVTITFDNSDKEKSPIGFDQYPKISVTRQVVLGGGSKYLINGHKAQQIQVLNLFQSVQLNINNPNFLIMQGKITKMLNMKPTEILGLIEEAAGTKMYEWQREKAEKTMSKKNLKLQTTENLLREEVEPKLKHLAEQKRIMLEYQDIQTELETLSKAVAAHDYQSYTQRSDAKAAEFEQSSQQVEATEQRIRELNSEIATLENDLEKMKVRRQEEASKSDIVKSYEEEENQLTNELTRLSTTKELKLQGLAAQKETLEKNKADLAQLEKEKLDKQEEHVQLEKSYFAAKEALEQSKEALSKKEELLSTLSTGISSKGSTDGGYMSHLQEANKKVSDAEVQAQKNRMRIGHLNEELKGNQKAISDKQADIASIKKETERRQQVCSKLHEKLTKIGFDPDTYAELKRKEKDLNARLSSATQRLRQFQRQNPRFDFSYERPTADFNAQSVKGFAGELFELPEKNAKDSVALETCGGNRLFNVVVDTEVTGSQLLDKGRLRKRVTIIPLNKITSHVIDSKRVNLAKQIGANKVDLALNLIEYDKSSSKAMEYIFGNRLICDDPQTAEKVTFNPKVHAGSVTLEGDYYDPEGRLSGGSRRTSESTILKFNQFRSLKQEVDAIQGELHLVTMELAKLAQLVDKTGPIQQELRTEQYQIEALEKRMNEGDSASFLKHNEDIKEEIANLENQISDLDAKTAQYTAEAREIEKDMKEFNSDGSKKLRELKQQVTKLSKDIQAAGKDVNSMHQTYQDSRIATEQLQTDIDTLSEDINKAEEQTADLNTDLIDSEMESLNVKLAAVRDKITAEREKLAGINEELDEMTRVLNGKRSDINGLTSDLAGQKQSLEQLTVALKGTKEYLDGIIEAQDWVLDEKVLESVLEQYPNINPKECHGRIDQLTTRIDAMKKKGVNTNIMSQIEQHEKHETSLKTKIRQINKDKKKIEETIAKLDDYKRTELQKTYKKVSEDFGQIFSELLPHAFAKLVPVNMMDVTKGLEVKVQLGNVWKESLVELSGGQRSLVALALIMALLQFKPAPMYILDEIDAALDLNHTQSIGHLIKTRFKGSQFFVVSLKEGMFTNANRLFKVRFQEGTSVVTAT